MPFIDSDDPIIRIARPWGEVVITNNELGIASHVDDPPGLRLESVSAALGKVSGSHIRDDGSSDEHVLVQFKRDERARGRDDLNYGELTIHIKGPGRSPGDDGMTLAALFLHDYTWIRGLNGLMPAPPVLKLPPLPPVAIDPWTTVDARVQHTVELDAINAEFDDGSGLAIDASAYQAYLDGRNTNLKEVHDDMVRRAGRDPCGGTRFP